MKLTGFDNEWDALQHALQGQTTGKYSEADLKADSAMPIQKLNRQWNIRLAIIACVIPLWLFAVIYFDHTLIRVLMGIIFIANIWSMFLGVTLKLKMKEASKANLPVLDYLKVNYQLINKAIRLEERVFIFIYPISVAAGFFAGTSIKEGLDAVFSSPERLRSLLLIMLGCMVVITPLSHFLAKWLNKVSFGNYLKELKRIISSYETEKQ